MQARDFEHGLLDKAFNYASTVRTDIKQHDALLRDNAEYRKLFRDFAQATQTMFKGVDAGPEGYRDPSVKDFAKILKNCLLHPRARKTAITAADKMHKIYQSYLTNPAAAPAPPK